MDDEKFFRNLTDAVDHWVDKELAKNSAPSFGGKPGEPVPEADPDDLKTIWGIHRELEARHPGETVATGRGLLKWLKPGANLEATCYRASMLALTAKFIATEQLVPDKDGMLDGRVFRAAATIPMEWIGAGIRQGMPFDIEHFLQLCAA
jgi:hypothetical protein